MNGSLPLKGLFGKGQVLLYGGAYGLKPSRMVGVKFAKEIPFAADGQIEIDMSCPDYQTPTVEQVYRVLPKIIDHLVAGNEVYGGCMAGRGRTGTAFSILARVWGERDPVQYVRDTYYSHAVETEGQRKFVETFPITLALRFKVLTAKALIALKAV